MTLDFSYAFTIKYIKAEANRPSEPEQQYRLALVMYDMISFHKGILTEHVFELDSIGRVHIHGTMLARKGLLLSRFKRPYFHIHLDPLKTIFDQENWTKYIHKDVIFEQKDITNQIQGEYSFIDTPAK